MVRRRRNTDEHAAELDAVRADIRRAEEAAAEADQATARTAARWPRVDSILTAAREIRERNHLAEDLRVIFRGHG